MSVISVLYKKNFKLFFSYKFSVGTSVIFPIIILALSFFFTPINLDNTELIKEINHNYHNINYSLTDDTKNNYTLLTEYFRGSQVQVGKNFFIEKEGDKTQQIINKTQDFLKAHCNKANNCNISDSESLLKLGMEYIAVNYDQSISIMTNKTSVLFPPFNQQSELFNLPHNFTYQYFDMIHIAYYHILKQINNQTANPNTNDLNFKNIQLVFKPNNINDTVRLDYNPSGSIDPINFISLCFTCVSSSYFFILVLISDIMINENRPNTKMLLSLNGVSNFENILSWLLSIVTLLFPTTLISTLLIIFLWMKPQLLTITYSFLAFFVYTIHITVTCIFFSTTSNGGNFAKFTTYIYFLIPMIVFICNYFSFSLYGFLLSIFPYFPHLNFVLLLEFIFLSTNYKDGLSYEVMSKHHKGNNFFGLLIRSFAVLGLKVATILCLHLSKKLLKKLYKPKRNNSFSNEEDKRTSYFQSAEEKGKEFEIQIIKNECLSLKSITKSFDDFVAVKNFTNDFYRNEIFVLLGENGAGKSTLFNIISRTIAPDSGEIEVDNKQILEDKDYVQNELSMVPQYNVCYPNLTVKSQIQFVQELRLAKASKSYTNETIAIETDSIISKIGLKDYENNYAFQLSGGNLRKLVLAFSLVNDSTVLLLDEPTSGLDYVSKKILFDLLREIKRKKIIILTTHSMEEAEVFGDTIGIMSRGELICRGSSDFLKTKYPCGLTITFAMKEENTFRNKVEVLYEMKLIEPRARFTFFAKDIMKINFPEEFLAKRESNSTLFRRINEIKLQSNIDDYSISTTTLEDVFTLINDEQEIPLKARQKIDKMLEVIEKEREGDAFAEDSSSSLFNKSSSLQDFKRSFGGSLGQKFGQGKVKHSVPYEISKKENLLVSENKGTFSTLISRYFLTLKNSILLNLAQLLSMICLVLLFLVIASSKFVQTFELTIFDEKAYFPMTTKLKYKIKNNSSRGESLELENFITRGFMRFVESTDLSESFTKNYISIFYNDTDLIYKLHYDPSSVEQTHVIVSHILKRRLGELEILENDTLQYYNIYIHDGKYRKYFSILLIALLTFIHTFSSLLFMKTAMEDKINETKILIMFSIGNYRKYWLSLFLFDLIKYLVFGGICYVIYCSVWGSFFWKNFPITVLSGVQIILISYICTFLSNSYRKVTVYLTVLIFSSIGVFMLFQYIKEITYFHGFILLDLWPLGLLSHLLYLIDMDTEQERTKENEKFLTLENYRYFIYWGTAYLLQTILLASVIEILEGYNLKKLCNKPKKSQITEVATDFPSANISGDALLPTDDSAVSAINERTEKKRRALELVDLSVGFSPKKQVLSHLSMTIHENEKFGLMGYNGSGKTTLIKAITKIHKNVYGKILCFGVDLLKNFAELSKFIGYCPQIDSLFPKLTVRETLYFYASFRERRINILKILIKYKLFSVRNVYCKNLSGGNKRKLLFAIALMSEPQLALLDEPTTGVDPDNRKIMWNIINDLYYKKMKKNKTFNLLIATQSFEEAEVLCDNIGWISDGKIKFRGNCEKLKIKSCGYYLKLKFLKPDMEKVGSELINIRKLKFDNIKQAKSSEILRIDQCIMEYDTESIYYLISLEEVCGYLIKEGVKVEFRERVENIVVMNIQIPDKEKEYIFENLLNVKICIKNISELSIGRTPIEQVLQL